MADPIPQTPSAEGQTAQPTTRQWSIPLESRFGGVLNQVKTSDEPNPKPNEAKVADPLPGSDADEHEPDEEGEIEKEPETEESPEGEEEGELESESDDEAEEEKVEAFPVKVQKRIDKLTARAKSAEERAKTLETEVQTLRSLAEAPVAAESLPKIHGHNKEGIPTLKELMDIEREALRFKDWAKKHRKEGGTLNGEFVGPEEVAEMLESAEEDIRETIPFYRSFLQKKEQASAQAVKAFPEFFGDPTRAAEIRRTALAAIPGLAAMPDQDMLAGALIVGLRVAGGKAKIVTADVPKKAAVTKPQTKPQTKPLKSTTPPSSSKANLAALEARARREGTPEAFAAYRAAKREA